MQLKGNFLLVVADLRMLLEIENDALRLQIRVKRLNVLQLFIDFGLTAANYADVEALRGQLVTHFQANTIGAACHNSPGVRLSIFGKQVLVAMKSGLPPAEAVAKLLENE